MSQSRKQSGFLVCRPTRVGKGVVAVVDVENLALQATSLNKTRCLSHLTYINVVIEVVGSEDLPQSKVFVELEEGSCTEK